MFGKLKGKALIGALAVLDAVLAGTVVALTRKLIRNTAQNEVVDAVIKENEENVGESVANVESSASCGKEDIGKKDYI
ncbi:MAG: hypothetical protein K6G81_09850 [Lachnospiraceae bacterium]|nr:hypothetical protein [Lachnospiraceae bacterium]